MVSNVNKTSIKQHKTAIRQDKTLLIIAKDIFGANVVNNAFVCAYNIYSTREEVIERIEENMFTRIDDVIQYDSETIILEFVGGNMVRFTNSEWASIEKVKGSAIYHT